LTIHECDIFSPLCKEQPLNLPAPYNDSTGSVPKYIAGILNFSNAISVNSSASSLLYNGDHVMNNGCSDGITPSLNTIFLHISSILLASILLLVNKISLFCLYGNDESVVGLDAPAYPCRTLILPISITIGVL
jgi:hypothetical protein